MPFDWDDDTYVRGFEAEPVVRDSAAYDLTASEEQIAYELARAAAVDADYQEASAYLDASGYAAVEMANDFAGVEQLIGLAADAENARVAEDAEPPVLRWNGTDPTEDRLAVAMRRVAAGTFTPRPSAALG